MHFVLLVLGTQVAGVCTALVYWPGIPPHLRPEIAAAMAAYTVMAALVLLANLLLAEPDSHPSAALLCETASLCVPAPDNGLDESQRQKAMFFAHEFCLRHFGLQHSVMLSVQKESAEISHEWLKPRSAPHP